MSLNPSCFVSARSQKKDMIMTINMFRCLSSGDGSDRVPFMADRTEYAVSANTQPERERFSCLFRC